LVHLALQVKEIQEETQEIIVAHLPNLVVVVVVEQVLLVEVRLAVLVQQVEMVLRTR
jgi:hypothetical protein